MTPPDVDPVRRRVLGLGAAAALAASFAGGLGWQFRSTKPVALRRAVLPPAGRSDGPRLLVAYATMMGSTGDQARLIAQAGSAAGFRVTLAPVVDEPDPTAHDAVILGSAVRSGAWLEEARGWALWRARALASRPAALFQCSMTAAALRRANGGSLAQEDGERLRRDLRTMLEAVPALARAPCAFFSGAVRYDYLRPPMRILYPVVSGSLLLGDHRDPAEIDAFARAVFARPEFRALLA